MGTPGINHSPGSWKHFSLKIWWFCLCTGYLNLPAASNTILGHWKYSNKARYTTASITCGWAGGVTQMQWPLGVNLHCMTDGRTEGWTDRWMDEQTDRRTNRPTNQQINGLPDQWTDGPTDRWTDRQTVTCAVIKSRLFYKRRISPLRWRFGHITKKIWKNINRMPTNIKFSVYKTSANLPQDATFPVTVCDAICEQYSFKK